MKYEWPLILGITAVVALGLLFVSAEGSATIGWLSLVCGFCWLVWPVISSGRKARRDRPFDENDGDAVIIHRWQIAILTGFIFIGVVGIELGVRKAGGLWGHPWFLALHLFLVLGMTLAFIGARVRYTGIKNPSMHRKFVYGGLIVFYLAALITGTILLYDKFSLREHVTASEVRK